MPPQQTRDFKDSVSSIGSDDLNQQLRRQTIERYVSPSGNGSELGTLARRFGKTEAEQVAAHLEPDAIEGLKNLSSISTPVYESLKGSTTAKRVVPVAESRAALAGLATAAGGLIGWPSWGDALWTHTSSGTACHRGSSKGRDQSRDRGLDGFTIGDEARSVIGDS